MDFFGIISHVLSFVVDFRHNCLENLFCGLFETYSF